MYSALRLAAFGIAASGAVAVPTGEVETFRSPRHALSRRDCSPKFGDKPTKTYGDYSGCSSSFSDGQGTWVRSDDVFHYGVINADKCWTDLVNPTSPRPLLEKKKNTHIGTHQFYVSSAPHQAAWTKLEGGGVDCGVTSECSTAQERGTETCTSTTFSTSASVDFSIVKDVLGASASVGAEWTDSTCNSSGLTNSCTWDDQECHALWASESQTLIKGYIRRRCNFHGDDAGDVTVWSTDYDIYVPTGNSVAGCAALCSDTSYPGSLP